MAGTFNFCPNSLVPELLPPEAPTLMTFNGWTFSSKPTTPFQSSWKVTLYGLQWYLNSDGTFNLTTNPTRNAAALEKFYRDNQTWDNFAWKHPHIATTMQVRFKSPVIVPAAIPNSNGLCDAVEVYLIHHNPGY